MSNFTVTVKTIPGGTREFNSNEAITVERAMGLADIANPKNWTPKVGGETVRLTDEINSDTTLTLIKTQIKGNQG